MAKTVQEPRTSSLSGTSGKCRKLGCPQCVRSTTEANFKYLCLAARPQKYTKTVGWERTPNHPDGFKFHPLKQTMNLPGKPIRKLTTCPQGKW